MSRIDVTPEQRLALATAADRPRTAAEAQMLARLADEAGMPGSAAAWREVAADGIATSAVRQAPVRHAPQMTPPVSGNAASVRLAAFIVGPILLVALFFVGIVAMPDRPPAPPPPPVATVVPTTTTTAPTPVEQTTTAPPVTPLTGPTEVYVEDGGDDDDGESRFCRKRRWC